MRPFVLVGLALLVALAGCPAPADSDRGTVTPAPLPTTEPPYPAGVSDERVDAETLVDTHARTLATTNYTLLVERRVSIGNRTMSQFERSRRVAVGETRYAGQYGRSVSTPVVPLLTMTVEYWASGDGYAVRQRDEGGTDYLGWSSFGDPIRDVDRSRRLNRTLSTVPVGVADRTEEAVVLTGRQPGAVSDLPAPTFVTDQRNATLTARVTHHGVITDLRYAYDARVDDESVRVTYQVSVTAVGSTTVPRPNWVDRAQNRTLG
jgi:hypothetical protein